MTFKNPYKTYKIKLTTLSPVFIGGGENCCLNKTQYVFNPIEKKVYIIDEKKWANFLIEKDLIQKFSKYIIDKGTRANIYQWIKDTKININYKSFSKYSIEATDLKNDIHGFIKNHESNPYIPGSSIKGAIRTAILFKKIKDNKNVYASVWEDLKKALDLKSKENINDSLNKIILKIEENEFYKLKYENTEKNGLSAVNDIFKGLIINDSKPINSSGLIVLQKYDLSTLPNKFLQRTQNKEKYDHTLPIYREYLKPFVDTEFSITIDKNLLKNYFYINNFKNIKDCLNNFSDSLVKENAGLYETFDNFKKEKIEFYYPNDLPSDKMDLNKNLCLMPIGGGAGFLTKTIIHAIAPNIEEANEFIKNYLDIAFTEEKYNKQTKEKIKQSSHKHTSQDNYISPRSLKLATIHSKNKLENLIVGWCHLEVIEEDGKPC